MKLILKILLPVLILGLALFGARKLVASRPAPQKREVRAIVPSIETVTVAPATHHPEVRSYGTVQAHDLARLTPELTARIVWLADAFRVGERVEADQPLVRLERRDFEAALVGRQAELAQLERQLAEERILADQAKADWIASGRPLAAATAFRLRQPQLTALEAQIRSAEAAVDTAELNLERTILRAPFTARVLSRDSNLGEIASPQTPLGELAATDLAEVRLPFTPEQMARIDAALDPAALAAEPLAVELRVPEHPGHRPARIVRLDPVTDARNQVRYLIAELDRPFAVEPFALPLGTFVNATLRGRALEDTLRVPASALVDDRYLWTVGPGKTLARLPVERLATEDGEVIVRPAEVAGGITVATRPLTTFRPGDPVRLKPAVSSH